MIAYETGPAAIWQVKVDTGDGYEVIRDECSGAEAHRLWAKLRAEGKWPIINIKRYTEHKIVLNN